MSLIVEFKKVPEEIESAAEFLRSKIEREVKMSGNWIRIDDARARDVKLLLHKFLHHRELNSYTVLNRSGILEIVPS